jgi:hypothetical protein
MSLILLWHFHDSILIICIEYNTTILFLLVVVILGTGSHALLGTYSTT